MPGPLFGALLFTLFGCDNVPTSDDENATFPIEPHSLLPPTLDADTDEEWRTSVGKVPQPVDEQPIHFNHSIHAGLEADGGMEMDCQYCHSTARKSQHAGVPPTQTCIGCHQWVPTDGRPELDKLKTYFPGSGHENEGEPIPWVKVHDLPDFVHFNHSRHIKGGVECTECHADMSKETVAVRSPDMTMEMGWCLECHGEHPSVDDNYGVEAEARRAELKDCYTCHK